MKILIVDDEPNILEILEAYLIVKNYQVFRAVDGQEALETAATIRPDLIVLDLMLPDISGSIRSRTMRSGLIVAALETAATIRPDLIVLDLMIADISGMKCCEK